MCLPCYLTCRGLTPPSARGWEQGLAPWGRLSTSQPRAALCEAGVLPRESLPASQVQHWAGQAPC